MIISKKAGTPGAPPAAGKRYHFGPFLRNREGATAIEFAVLALPFCLLVFAILESCISFAAQQLLMNATDEVARQLRTGQLKEAAATEAEVHSRICGKLEILVAKDCPGLEIDLRSFTTFEQAALIRTKFASGGDIDTSDFVVDPGPSLSRNMLRVYYRWPVITDFMRRYMSNLPDGKTLLFATATWQNEPFDD